MKRTLPPSVIVAMLSVAPAFAQTPVPPVPAARPTVASNATDYKLVVGDKLRVEVYRDPQMSQNLQIRPDGKITLPLVGDVVAAGKPRRGKSPNSAASWAKSTGCCDRLNLPDSPRLPARDHQQSSTGRTRSEHP